MNYKYNVEVLGLRKIHEVPDAWSSERLKEILNFIEYEGVDEILEEELRDMTTMALSDLEPEEAAEAVLEVRFGDLLTSGQRKNLSEELKDGNLWEEYAKISFHEELFNVGCMLYWAFPKEFPFPKMIQLEVKVHSLNADSFVNLKQANESFLARLFSDGMDDHNPMNRLFKDELASNTFVDAKDIIWKWELAKMSENDHTAEFTAYSSCHWLDELSGIKNYESTAYSDGQLH